MSVVGDMQMYILKMTHGEMDIKKNYACLQRKSVYCAVRTEYLNIKQVKLILYGSAMVWAVSRLNLITKNRFQF